MPVLAALALLLLVPAVPPPPAEDVHVVDTAEAMTEEGVAAAEAVADEWQARTTNDVVVAVVPTLEGLTVEQYTAELFATWQPGLAGADNGVAVVIAVEDQQLRVEAGLGLADELSLERAGEIASAALPALGGDDVDGAVLGIVTGVVSVVDAAVAAANTTTTTPVTFDPDAFEVEDSSDGAGFPGWVVLVVLVLIAFAVYQRLWGGSGWGTGAEGATSSWGSSSRRRRSSFGGFGGFGSRASRRSSGSSRRSSPRPSRRGGRSSGRGASRRW